MLETFSIEVDPEEAGRLRELLAKRRLDGVSYSVKKRWFSFWHRFTITAPPWVVAQLKRQAHQLLQDAWVDRQ